MKNELITDIVQQMLPYLDNSQTKEIAAGAGTCIIPIRNNRSGSSQ